MSASGSRARALGLAIAAGLLGVAAGAWFGRSVSPPALADTTVERVAILPPEGTSIARGDAPQISPDGRHVAFVGAGASGRNVIHVRSLDSLDARVLPGTEDASLIFWAPDSQRLGFFAGGQLKTLSLSGGTPQSLAPAPVARGGTWSRQDVILFVGIPSEPPRIVPASGGESKPVPIPDGQLPSRWFPAFLPDGRHYLYLRTRADERLGAAISVASVDSTETRELLRSAASATYADPGYILFRRGVALMAQRFDPQALELVGSAFQVADDVGFNAITYQGLFSASADGVLVYQSSAPGSQLIWFDRRGTRLGVAAPPADYSTVCLTGDGKRVVYDLSDPATGMVDLWATDVAGGAASRLTFHRAVDFYPVCGPTGQDVVFSSLREGPPNLYRLAAGAPGSETAVLRSPAPKIASDWSRDGRWLVYSELNRETGFDIRVVPLSGGEPVTFTASAAEESAGRLSPDGRWMAYQSNETGTSEVYVQPFPATGARWQISKGGGTQPQWRRDGGELYYIAQDKQLMAVSLKASRGQLAAGEPLALFQTRATGREPSNLNGQYAAAGDGTRFLMSTATDSVLPVTMVHNWPALAGR